MSTDNAPLTQPIAPLPSEPPPTVRLAPLPAVRRLRPGDRPALVELIAADGLFEAAEVSVALELIDRALAETDEYYVLVAECDGQLSGYVCYGPTPMTVGTWDLYWIVTHRNARGRGVARALILRMESELRAAGVRLVRVETSQLDGYGAAHAFYQRLEYPVAARLRDFYKPGDDLLVLLKRL